MANSYQLGIVDALWRFPVKSMRGEPLTEALITERGVAGDRQWALRELRYGGVMSARSFPMLLAFKSSYAADPALDSNAPVLIELPDGNSVAADDPATAAILSALLKREVRLERVRTMRPTQAEFEAIMRGEALPPSRDFFDEDVIHAVATGTLAHLRNLQGGSADFDPRRFRANIFVDTGAAIPGFLEDQWLDGTLTIGDEVRIAGLRPAIRCAMTTHPQDELPHDPSILRTAYQHHQAYVGVFAAVAATGTIRRGDPVWFNPMSVAS
ncbi:MAG TPA: MOSC N-terminal beta barrel domain-containing protein [Candidatus Binataceae bacterium]|nr:MOSC N-terminal beta barrel domain-containing protein [Candidatus Binataceae bacterium]